MTSKNDGANNRASVIGNPIVSHLAEVIEFDKNLQLCYATYEAEDYKWSDKPEDRGFFAENPIFCKPTKTWDLIYRTIRCELYIFGSNKTIWDFTVLPVMRWISRLFSGIKGSSPVDGHLACGYYGWGKMCMLHPDVVSDRFKEELQNISIVAALFLTITIPLITEPPDAVMDDGAFQWVFVTLMSCAVGGQVGTAVIALAMLTNLNKCVGDSSGYYFVQSVFNPYNGIAGIVGPCLYVGAILSWGATLFAVLLIVFKVYSTDEGVLSLLVVLLVFGVYLFALIYGTITEIRCSKIELQDLVNANKGKFKHHLLLKQLDDKLVYVADYDKAKADLDANK